MPRAGLSTDAVVEHGARWLEEHPHDELTLAALATTLGVRTPSLYKHVDGLTGLRRGIMLRAKRDLAAALAQATIGRARDDGVRALAVAYRRWALAHPAQYPLTVRAPEPDDDGDQAASSAALDVITTVLAGYELAGDDAVDAIRFLRSVIHGFVSLETADAFRLPLDLEASFVTAVEAVVAALATWGRR